jgi:hypothetical protein
MEDRMKVLRDYKFVITVTSTSLEAASEELAGALQDAKDSQIIDDYTIEEEFDTLDDPHVPGEENLSREELLEL